MRLSPNFLVLALVSSAVATQAQTAIPVAPPQLPASTAHFVIYQGDKTVGSADRSVQATGAGYAVTSQGKMSLAKFNYGFTNTQHLDHSLNLVSDQITGTVNGKAVTFSAHADSTGKQFQIDINAQGKQTQNTVDRHQHLVLLADLDPAAYTLLVQVGLTSPPTSWILIPKEQGLLVPAKFDHGSSVRGRLNGTQVDVQHLTTTVGEQNPVSVDLFYGRDGDVLEADLPQQNFFVVRDGFKLIDRPQEQLPQGQAPPAQGGQQQGGQQNGQPQNGQQQNGSQQNGQQQGGAPQYPAPQNGYPQVQPN